MLRYVPLVSAAATAVIIVVALYLFAVTDSSAQVGADAKVLNELAAPWTLNAQPPLIDDRTKILFDGENWSDHWTTRDGSPSRWLVQDDGSVQVAGGTGDAITRESFGDFQLHLEFFCPPIPPEQDQNKQGQARSNSGVYLHGRYEIQVLDSHGQAPANNLCGGIYQIAAPLVNASRPAGEWQSYDIIFRTPRFDDDHNVTEPARVTVIHNGVVIHNNLILPSTTPGGLDRNAVAEGPILLQDHGDPVRYRNIWIRRL